MSPEKSPGKKKNPGGRPRLPRHDEAYRKALGEAPPSDPLDMPEMFLRMYAEAARLVATDKRMTEKERRSELRALGKVTLAMLPVARLRRAEQLLRADFSRVGEEPEVEVEDAASGAGKTVRGVARGRAKPKRKPVRPDGNGDAPRGDR